MDRVQEKYINSVKYIFWQILFELRHGPKKFNLYKCTALFKS